MIVRSTHIASYFIQDAADLHKHTREGGAVGLIYSGSQEQNHLLFFYYFLCLNHHVFVCLHQPLWRREATTSSSALPSNIIPDNSDRTERGFKLSWNATGSCVKGLALIQNMSLAAGTTIPRSLFDPDLQPLSESVLCRHFGDVVWRYCVHPGAAKKKKKHLRFKSLFLTLDSQQRQTTIFF